LTPDADGIFRASGRIAYRDICLGIIRLVMADGAVTVALGLDGMPVTPPRPAVGWRGATIRADITFGPYPHRLDLSEVLLWIGGEGPATLPAGARTLPADTTFLYEVELGLGD
jgi:hypothetical protein